MHVVRSFNCHKVFLHKNHCTLSRVSAQPRQLSFPFGNRCAVSIKSGIDVTNFPSSRALFAKAEEFRFLGTCQSSVFFDPCILVFSSLLGRVSAGVSRPWVFFYGSAVDSISREGSFSSFLGLHLIMHVIFFFRFTFQVLSLW